MNDLMKLGTKCNHKLEESSRDCGFSFFILRIRFKFDKIQNECSVYKNGVK